MELAWSKSGRRLSNGIIRMHELASTGAWIYQEEIIRESLVWK